MNNRKRKAHSYDKYNKQNIIVSNLEKDHKKKVHSSLKIRKLSKDILSDLNNKESEIRIQPSENNLTNISTEKNKNRDYSEIEPLFKSSEKNQLKLYQKENDNITNYTTKNENNLDIIQKEENEEFLYGEKFNNNNKSNYLEKEKEKNNTNNQSHKLLVKSINNHETEHKKLNFHSFSSFRHSTYDKYRRENENKKIYITRRFIDFSKILNNLEIKNMTLKMHSAKRKYEQHKFKNNTKENEKNIKKFYRNGYRYKEKYRQKYSELNNGILDEINKIQEELLFNEDYENNNNDGTIIHKKIDIKIIIESNNNFINERISNNKIYNNRYSSENEHNSLDYDAKSNINPEQKIRNNYIKNKIYNNKLENNTNKIISFNDINNNSYLLDVHNYNKNYTENNNIININNTYNIYNQNYIQNTKSDAQQFPQIKKTKINLSNLIDYKYNYYINKKNKKWKKLNKESISNESDKISNLTKELMKMKNYKKNRFHRKVEQKEEVM